MTRLLSESLATDLLEGADQIAEWYFGDPNRRRAVYHLAATGRIRVFRMGQTICARKSTLLADIAEQERAARKDAPAMHGGA